MSERLRRGPTLLLLSLGACACGSMLTEAEIEATREVNVAVETMHDFEQMERIEYALVGHLEGLHAQYPDNVAALELLTRQWTRMAASFMADDRESALDAGNGQEAEYHRRRASAGFARAKFYARAWLHAHGEGSAQAIDDGTLSAWLSERFADRDDARGLLWAGHAYVAHGLVEREAHDQMSVGAALLEHSVRLSPGGEHGLPHLMLARYHGATAPPDLERVKHHLALARAVAPGYLPTRTALALEVHCPMGDRVAYRSTLENVISAGDALPAARVDNTLALRAARRRLDSARWDRLCRF